MKVYLAHSTGHNYVNELYEPLKQIEGFEIYFPHDQSSENKNSKEIILSSDIILAEISHPSTGQGIELGWADSGNIPIVCIYKEGTTPSTALKIISNDFFEYSDSNDLGEKVASILQEKSSKLVD